MSTLNRVVAPSTKDINKFDFPLCEKATGRSGIPVYYIKSAVDQILRIEFVFDAGIVKQHQKVIAGVVNSMLSEGTQKRTAEQIADSLDFYGSYFQPRCLVDDAQITLYCLKKHLGYCLEVVEDVLIDSQFPDNELNILINNNKQKLKIQQEKTNYLCRKSFYKNIFGEKSPISSFSESIDYDNFSRETLNTFFKENYLKGLKYITAAGDVDDSVITLLQNIASNFSLNDTTFGYKIISSPTKKIYLKKEKSAQATIRLGKQNINRSHQDFRKLQITNLILGGYFGSRLMKNIREEKGLTYGIYSVLESYLDDACFYIEADVNSKKTQEAITEIENELKKINQSLVGDKELNTAKNYYLGSILRGIDGPFTIMDRNRIIIDYGFRTDYYEELLDIIKETSAEEIRDLSNKYFRPDALVHVVCGG